MLGTVHQADDLRLGLNAVDRVYLGIDPVWARRGTESFGYGGSAQAENAAIPMLVTEDAAILPGTSGNYLSAPDINLLSAETAQGGRGTWGTDVGVATAPTFTRASSAFNPTTGATAASGAARHVQGVNLLAAAFANAETEVWGSGGGAGASSAAVSSEKTIIGANSIKLITNGASVNMVSSVTTYTARVKSSTQYTLGIWMYTDLPNRRGRMNFVERSTVGSGGVSSLGTPIDLVPGQWTLVSHTLTTASTTKEMYVIVRFTDDTDSAVPSGNVVYMDKVFLREGPSTQWTPGGQTAVLIEEGTTNLLPVGMAAAGTPTAATKTTGQSDPFGGTNAILLTEDTANTSHYIEESLTSSTAQRTISVYAKSNGRDVMVGDSGAGERAAFNLTTGAVTQVGGNVSSAYMVPVGGGWWRCVVVIVPGTTIVRYRIRTMSGIDALYTGDGTSGIFLSHPQVEALTYATSWRDPANGARAIEQLVVPDAAAIATFTPGKCTIEVDFIHTRSNGTAQTLVDFDQGTNLNRVMIRIATTGDLQTIIGDGTATSTQTTGSTVSPGRHRAAAVWDGTQTLVYLDGVLNHTVARSPAATAASFPAIRHVGSRAAANYANMAFSGFRLSNRARTATELAAHTAPLAFDGSTTYLLDTSNLTAVDDVFTPATVADAEALIGTVGRFTPKSILYQPVLRTASHTGTGSFSGIIAATLGSATPRVRPVLVHAGGKVNGAWTTAATKTVMTVTGTGFTGTCHLGLEFEDWVDTQRNVSIDYACLRNDATQTFALSRKITGDIEIEADVAAVDVAAGSSVQPLLSKDDAASQRGVTLSFRSPTMFARLSWSENGSTLKTVESTAAWPPAKRTRGVLKATLDVDNGAGGHTVTFYADGVQLGDPVVTAGVTSVWASTAAMAVGSFSNNGSNSSKLKGAIYDASIRQGIDGLLVGSFDATDHVEDANTLVSALTGETWTIIRTGDATAEVIHRPAWIGFGAVYLTIPHRATLALTTENFWSFVIFATRHTAFGALLTKRDDTGTLNGWEIQVNGGSDQLSYILDDGPTTLLEGSDSDPTTGAWQTALLQRKDGNLIGHLNGEEVSRADTVGSVASTAPLRVLARGATPGGTVPARVLAFAFGKGMLTEAEIARLGEWDGAHDTEPAFVVVKSTMYSNASDPEVQAAYLATNDVLNLA